MTFSPGFAAATLGTVNGSSSNRNAVASSLEQVKRYIANQEERHHKVGFQEELRALLRHHRIEWDERYIWD